MQAVMTVLEARVARERWDELLRTFRERMGVEHLPPQLLRSQLVQNQRDPETWQLLAVWRDREALDAYRGSVETPGGVVLFRSVEAEPSLSIYDVAHEVVAPR